MPFQIMSMENEQEDLQFLGFLGIFKESLKIILTWFKIFLQIFLAFILPNSFLFLANHWISRLLFGKINHNFSTLYLHKFDSPTYYSISKSLSKEWATYWLIKTTYFILTMIFSLLSISAVVYTVAFIYSGKQITFRKVISVVPKVWKRLMITFLCNACIMFGYMLILSLVIIIPMVFMYKPGKNPSIGLTIILLIIVTLLLLGFFYMTMIWQLANVISVMEKSYGFKALIRLKFFYTHIYTNICADGVMLCLKSCYVDINACYVVFKFVLCVSVSVNVSVNVSAQKMHYLIRSKELIKGKMGTAYIILLMFNICSMPILELIHELDGSGLAEKICLWILSLFLWALFDLFGLVFHAIFYLVCKSYHHESIDKSLLADHLDVYLSEYVPLKGEVQLEQV